ncbi:uncharacterized protein [Lepidochelys kempii]|uniref:uncharacterized protein n=1 Tax=Lepidochelys kempii TaxID=8472 RepID=UPI003C6EB258
MDANTFREGLMEMICLSSTALTTFRLKNKGFHKIAGEMGRQLGVSTGHDAVHHLVVSTAESGHEGLLDIARRLKNQNLLLHLNLAKELEENKTQQKESSIIESEVSEHSHPSEIAGCSQTSISILNLFKRPSLRRLQSSQGNGDNSSTNSSEDDAFEMELDKQERCRIPALAKTWKCRGKLHQRKWKKENSRGNLRGSTGQDRQRVGEETETERGSDLTKVT